MILVRTIIVIVLSQFTRSIVPLPTHCVSEVMHISLNSSFQKCMLLQWCDRDSKPKRFLFIVGLIHKSLDSKNVIEIKKKNCIV